VLRVLGNLLKVDGFDFDTSEAVRDEALKGVDVSSKLNNAITGIEVKAAASVAGMQRVSDVPIYATDAVVRRSAPLQATADAATPQVWMHSEELNNIGVKSGMNVKVIQGSGSVKLACCADDKLPKGIVRVAAGHPATAALGAMFGTITVERA
jgi:NADH-quinone oxidoreductase subunit G